MADPTAWARIEAFCRERPGALLCDAPDQTILDVHSGKALALTGRVATAAERPNAETGRPYLVLALEDGAQIALADVGVAFTPVTASSGPLPDLPPAVCFRDLDATLARLEHFLLDHPDEAPQPEHLSLFLFSVAVVDGARAVGFEVSREERRLERIIGELEARKGAGG